MLFFYLFFGFYIEKVSFFLLVVKLVVGIFRLNCSRFVSELYGRFFFVLKIWLAFLVVIVKLVKISTLFF